jgi:hypothetical protein
VQVEPRFDRERAAAQAFSGAAIETRCGIVG